MSGGSGDRYYTQGAPTRTGSNNRGISSNRGLGSATSPRGYHGAQPPLGVGARLLGSPGRNTSSSLVQQRAALPKPDGNLCSYSLYECNTERLTGYEFCLRHILCDKNAPYKPCGYCGDSQSGLKCSRPAPCFNRGDSYCAQHTRVILAARQRSSKKRKSTPNILLESLASYKKSKVDNKTPADESASSLPALNPFQQRFDPEAEGLGLAALESDGLQIESEDMLIRDTYTGGGDGESEGESVDSEGEDSLQLAGVYTVEEVMRILKDKLVKLQKLYIDQFQRLVFKMKESRREYLVQLKEEKDAGLVNISDQPNKDLEYERLKAMMHYFCPSGREALLSTKHRDKRLSLSGSSSKQISFCQHTLTTTTKCNGVCVPMAKFCQKHILEEQGQVLYRACGVVTPADGPCETPVAALFSHTTCVFHTKIPVFNPSVHTDGEESNDKPPEAAEDDVCVKPVTKEDSISDVTNNTIQNNHEKKLKQETGLDPITPDLKNSNLGKQSEFLTKPQVEESKLQIAGSNDTIIKKEVVSEEVNEKVDVDVNNKSKSVVISDDRIVKKESESEQTLLTKENPIEKTVDNEKHLDLSENKIVEANIQHDNRTDIDMKDGFVDPGKNSKSEDIKGKMSDKELDGKNHEMDIEETDNKADVSKSNDDQASIVEAKVEDEEKSNKKSSKEKEIEESIKNDSSSIEKKDKSIEEENQVNKKSNEVIEKTDEVIVETDDIAQKLQGVPDKLDEVTEKSDEVTEKSDEVTEKSDEVTEKLEEVTEETDKMDEEAKKADEATEKSIKVAEKSDEVSEKSDELTEETDKMDEVAKKTNEATEKSIKVADKSEEAKEKIDEVKVKKAEVAKKTDGVADKSDEVTDKSDKLTVQADGVAEKTDEVAKKTDEETAKLDKLTVQADEVTYVTDEVTEITDEVEKKTDEVAKITEGVAEESNVDNSKSDNLSKKKDKA